MTTNVEITNKGSHDIEVVRMSSQTLNREPPINLKPLESVEIFIWSSNHIRIEEK
jgi:hypothetical protein